MMLPLLLLLLAITDPASPRVATSEEILFRSGSVQLAGTLTIPTVGNRAGRLPAVVLLGGSGPAPRGSVKAYADQLAGLGLVTLAFDKRGSGQSTGDWTDASLDDLADDASAALRLLAARPEVDPARVGVWGVSQAGWVVPLLAARSPQPAFSIVVTGGGATPREIEMYGYRQALEKGGASADERAKAEALLDHYFAWLGSGIGRAGLVAEIENARTAPWFRSLQLDRILPSDEARPKWAWVATYDPSGPIKQIRMPTLVILGAGDPLGPADLSAQRWRAAIAAGGNADAVVEVFEDMGHAARQGEGHNPSNPVSPAYLAAIERFVAKFVTVPK